ncbi:hypothetical protein KZO01_06560 [Kurthia zopfii]|uniref:Uncharacterized protein n=1 Tax=Kurthia zopfii TaxID=1650 RepID=A0A8B4Q954_9BACL|nr:hypothetical protein [Kurthia zopfii]PWI23476.1 hypothetical protein DF281_02740 [Kurthia zopfii]TDR39787.1 hypothetical protein DFR61_1102 [Kurthia zopfii]GEK30347.1 hypothetical protein KZO01_06560 [Kurthia zopfii]STX09236.1 Uncharacterised protein [Kurthia zopfii]
MGQERKYRSQPKKSGIKKPISIGLLITLGIIIGAGWMYFQGKQDEKVSEPQEKIHKEVKEEVKKEKPKVEESPKLSFEDFKGTFVGFEGEPYKSPVDSSKFFILKITESDFQSFNRWDTEYTSPITKKEITKNVLTLHVDSMINRGNKHSETGVEKFELNYEGDYKTLRLSSNGLTYYSMTTEDLQKYYSQSEIDYARIFMTMHGEPPLDMRAAFHLNQQKPNIIINHDAAGQPTEFFDEIVYPTNVTHMTSEGTLNEDGPITYKATGGGNITLFSQPEITESIPTKAEYIRVVQQEFNKGSGHRHIEPFEPYVVADFIKRVNFVYN